MTIQELYQNIDGDYEKAAELKTSIKYYDVARIGAAGVVDAWIDAGKDMDPTQLFEAAHAVKGVCANLGLVKISEEASRITEEYRPGNSRTCSDDQVKEMLNNIGEMYKKTVEGIHLYEAEN